LSAAFIARPSAEIDQAATVSADTFVVIVFVFFLLLVWLAARQRKNWARWALVVALALSVLSMLGSLNYGLTLALLVDLFSTGLAGAGLYFSFSDDAEKWFH
jgi:heme A synthase